MVTMALGLLPAFIPKRLLKPVWEALRIPRLKEIY